jgi:hypothetical protein
MVEPDIRFLGERIERIQAELRDLRGLRGEMAHFKAEMNDRYEALSARIDNVERTMDAGFASMDARFAQAHETMASNLAVVLAAIKESR